MEKRQMKVTDGLEVSIIVSKEHEFLMTTADVAAGFGIDPNSVRSCKSRNKEELIEGKHFVVGVAKCNDPCESVSYNENNQTYWTKRGIVRLGFFINSERAKMFRDWAEDLVVNLMEQGAKVESVIPLPEASRRKHNRLTQDRMVGILADVARIEDRDVRISILNKLITR